MLLLIGRRHSGCEIWRVCGVFALDRIVACTSSSIVGSNRRGDVGANCGREAQGGAKRMTRQIASVDLRPAASTPSPDMFHRIGECAGVG